MSVLRAQAEPKRRRRWTLRARALCTAFAVMSVLITAFGLRASKPSRSRSMVRTSVATSRKGPWVYGRADARFTIVEYADLECPYCREYFPILRRWIDDHPIANWQWHNLPLSMHDPAATQEARWAECVGETAGGKAFWDAVAWIYQHTRGDGAGLPAGAQAPTVSPELGACLASTRPDAVIRAEFDAAAREGIAATPTLRVLDRRSGKSLLLHGPVEADGLLSALDLLASQN